MITRSRQAKGSGRGLREAGVPAAGQRSEEHTSELQSQSNLVCRLLLEKKKKKEIIPIAEWHRLFVQIIDNIDNVVVIVVLDADMWQRNLRQLQDQCLDEAAVDQCVVL